MAEDNPGAIGLYAGAGFAGSGRRAGYYQRPAGPVDALILRLDKLIGGVAANLELAAFCGFSDFGKFG